ncbi:MAG: hypothetical protein NC120_06230 [Ruminococcus sp.]|nr:hypothetical protein [Ruminococcus sp.]
MDKRYLKIKNGAAIIAEHNGGTVRINICSMPDSDGIKDIDSVVGQILDTIDSRTVYWSDTRLCYWCFDYKLACGVWCENIKLSDSLKTIKCTVCL